MELTDFLLARIAEDETRARDMQSRMVEAMPGVPWSTYVQVPNRAITEFHRAQSPDRVLAECKAKRRIVSTPPVHDDGADSAIHDVLRLLALPYADHPDYREEWRP